MVMDRLVLVAWLMASLVVIGCNATNEGGDDDDSLSNPNLEADDGAPRTWTNRHGQVIELQDVTTDVRKSTMLVFATAWCKECRGEQPQVEAWADKWADRSRVVYVFSGSPTVQTQRLVHDRDITLRVLIDPVGQLADRFDVRATPTLILLDRTGKPINRWNRISRVSEPPAPPPLEESRVPGETEPWSYARGWNEGRITVTATDLGNGERAIAAEGRELGTTFNLLLVANRQPDKFVLLAMDHAVSKIRTDESILSEWKPDSLISTINQTAGRVSVPVGRASWVPDMLRAALAVSRATGGAFDITWKPLGEIWNRAEEQQQLPDPDELSRVLDAVNWRHVEVTGETVRFAHPDTQIGVAGFAKGYIIDRTFREVSGADDEDEHFQFRDVILNIGGDLRVSGRGIDGQPHRIRIADPWDPEKTAAWLTLDTPAAIATSGAYLRYRTINGTRYGHIVDPRTGYPPDFDGSVTVLTRDCAMADALATALFVMGPDDGLAFARKTEGVDAIFVTRDGIRSTLGDSRLQPGN